MRLNQYIAANTNYSRRAADELIKEGKVSIGNSVVTKLGTQYKEGSPVYINGRKITQKDGFTAIVYHKPKGQIVSHSDERGREVIFDSLPNGFKHFCFVGRLDYASSGLLILTDSPKVAHALEKSVLALCFAPLL